MNALKSLGAILLAVIVVWIMGNGIANIGKSLQEKRRAAAVLEKRSDTLNHLRVDLKTAEGVDAKFTAAFPPSNNILDFVSILESVAGKYSVAQTSRFGNIAPSQFSDPAFPLSEISYSTNLGGNVDILVRYLKDYETLPYFAKISSLTINAGSGWDADSNITLQGALYVKETGP